MTDRNDAAQDRFARPGKRHRFTARTVRVVEIQHPAEAFIRITVAGSDLADFASDGPGDHTRVYFPNPATGEYVAPTPVGPEEDGIVRPEAPMFARDFTPLNVRPDGEGSQLVDLDFLRHPDPGPAAAWAETAKVGDEIVMVGPRGSRGVPGQAERILCVVDASALPATARWIQQAPEGTQIDVIADLAPADLDWVERYLAELSGRDSFTVYEVFGDLADATRDVGVDEKTFVFAAGEASRLIPLRRLLKYELELPRAQYAISGYWKRGQVAFDHHAPIDPTDPEEN